MKLQPKQFLKKIFEKIQLKKMKTSLASGLLSEKENNDFLIRLKKDAESNYIKTNI